MFDFFLKAPSFRKVHYAQLSMYEYSPLKCLPIYYLFIKFAFIFCHAVEIHVCLVLIMRCLFLMYRCPILLLRVKVYLCSSLALNAF